MSGDWKSTPAGIMARTEAAEYFLTCLKLLGQGLPEEAARCVARVTSRARELGAEIPDDVLERTERFLDVAFEAAEQGQPERVRELIWDVMELWY